ncbi:formylmethanofuran dehydrogenase subunit C [Moorella sulfitireducens (nom. illeg.)]|uniref:formylmethanofuran dehydrogenase subunit C n=1 Tax=Neomoorella sulfitireducens TaxID=2972948 RepID=UPI0021AD03CC
MPVRITLFLKQTPPVPVEAESINPESVTAKDRREIEDLPLWVGNSKERVGDYFRVEVEETEAQQDDDNAPLATLHLVGDLSRFKRLGWGMSRGEMLIRGSVGPHTGAFMRGGTLVIQGQAGDWLGAHMQGGKILVQGSAGNFAGAAYRGYKTGMQGGTIIIRDDAGQMLGARMRRGVIAVGGNCGDFAGFGMAAGTVVVRGAPGLRAGAQMRRGTIILLQPGELLPTFYYDCTYGPLFWRLLYNYLQQEGFALPPDYREMSFKRFSGDANEGGKGEILVCQSLN